MGFLGLFAFFTVLKYSSAIQLNNSVFLSNRTGTEVVLLSIAYIHHADIFTDDNGLLRRIAYVETKDGTDLDTSNNGGIWAVLEDAFTRTKASDSLLLNKHAKILQNFRINWKTVQWSDMSKPLYSALAARLVLFIVGQSIPSDEDLQAQAQFWRDHYNANGSIEHFLIVAQNLKGDITDTTAAEYFIGFPLNHDDPVSLQLFVTTRDMEPVEFFIQTLLGFEFSSTAYNHLTTVVLIPSLYQVQYYNRYERKGIRISANGSIVIYGMNYQEYTSDAFLALPCSKQNLDEYVYYAGVTYDNNRYGTSQFLLVGCEDNTIIHLGERTVFLDRMETYFGEGNTVSTDMRIASNKPISFFSGGQCNNIPTGVYACDQLNEQFPNTNLWGKRFLSASLSGRSSADIYGIYAFKPATTVIFNCTPPFAMSSVCTTIIVPFTTSMFEIMTIPDNFVCAIESNTPVLVVQFASGQHTDYMQGDPFMMMLPPIEQYKNHYVINIPTTFLINFIAIFVASEYFQPEKIWVDETSQNNTLWQSIYCMDKKLCGYAATLFQDPGHHVVYHTAANAKVGVTVYGFGEFNSYGYTGGLESTPVDVNFAFGTYYVGEDAGILILSVERYTNTDTNTVVLVTTHSDEGTATDGEDFSTVIEVLTFKSGDMNIDVKLSIKNDDLFEGRESLFVRLTSGVGVSLPPNTQAEVIILDDETGWCPHETSTSEYGTFSWLVTDVGETRCHSCLYDRECEALSRSSVMRQCKSHNEWDRLKPSDNCITEITYQLRCIFSTVIVSRANAEEQASMLKALLEKFTATDQTADNLRIVSYFFSNLTFLIESQQLISTQNLVNYSVSILDSIIVWPEDAVKHDAPNIVQSFEIITENLVTKGDFMSFSIVENNIELQATYRTTLLLKHRGSQYIPILSEKSGTVTDVNSIDIPPSAFKNTSGINTAIVFGLYSTSRLFPLRINETYSENTTVGSTVIAAKIAGKMVNDLVEPVIIKLTLITQNWSNPLCVSYNFTDADGNWSTEGCMLVSVDDKDGVITCQCDHLTNFGVLVDINARTSKSSPSLIRDDALRAFSIVGSFFSMLSLVITIITLLAFRTMRKRDINIIHVQLCIAILLMLLFFLIGIDRTHSEAGCTFCSLLIQYFTMASVAWMGAEAVVMFQKLIIVFQNVTKKQIFITSLIAWSVPAPFIVLALLTLASGKNHLISQDNFCFIGHIGVFLGVFLVPILIMVVINTIIFVLVLRVLLRTIRRKLKDQSEKQKIHSILRALISIVSIMVLFGMQWIFGALTIAKATVVFQWLFVIFSSLQGIIIFVFLVLMGSDTRKRWVNVFNQFRANGIKWSQYLISATKSKTDTWSSTFRSSTPRSTSTLSTTTETTVKSENSKENPGGDSFLACDTIVSEAVSNEKEE